MSHLPWLPLLGFAPVALESLVILLRPTLLAPFAFLRAGERSFTVHRRKHRADPSAGYREPARKAVELPELPARVELGDAVLFCAGKRIAVRRAHGVGRRAIWLVRIDVEQLGDEIVLRARQALTPMSSLLFGIVGVVWMSRGASVPWPMWIAVPALFALVAGLQHPFTFDSRDAALSEAFDLIEAQFRRAVEEPPQEN